ncbi:MAG: TPM domain-containing protein [Bacteroidia bacterium]|nr:TPM domain-containing protein [Bacteroidia bacterium]
MFHSRIFFFFLLLFFCKSVSAQSLPEARGFVNDFEDILTAEQEQELNSYLLEFAQTTSNEITVASLRLPEDETVETYTVALAQKWGVGGAENNNGVLVAIFPGIRKIRIEVGYGLEGAIPDILATQIITEFMQPAFRKNDYYGGISQAVTALAKASQGEYEAGTPQEYYQKRSSNSIDPAKLIVLILIIGLFVILSRGNGGRGGRGGRGNGGGGGFIFWGGGSGGHWGGSGGGGFGGGDFGGFGGGDFGGGGGSGDW